MKNLLNYFKNDKNNVILLIITWVLLPLAFYKASGEPIALWFIGTLFVVYNLALIVNYYKKRR